VSSEEDRKKYGEKRSREAGIAHLEWEAGLKYDEEWRNKNNASFGEFTPQVLAAKETLVLYKWWKDERPKRLDPSEASGWSAYSEKKRKANGGRLFLAINTADRECTSKMLSISQKMEDEYEAEDTAMLIRLVKIRQSLWT
jgi:hypothetical protein